jgi:hypothetical protein
MQNTGTCYWESMLYVKPRNCQTNTRYYVQRSIATKHQHVDIKIAKKKQKPKPNGSRVTTTTQIC